MHGHPNLSVYILSSQKVRNEKHVSVMYPKQIFLFVVEMLSCELSIFLVNFYESTPKFLFKCRLVKRLEVVK